VLGLGSRFYGNDEAGGGKVIRRFRAKGGVNSACNASLALGPSYFDRLSMSGLRASLSLSISKSNSARSSMAGAGTP